MKHVHAELIKAWADGAKIQFFDRGLGEWVNTHSPAWAETYQYRIKPEEKSYGQILYEKLFPYPVPTSRPWDTSPKNFWETAAQLIISEYKLRNNIK